MSRGRWINTWNQALAFSPVYAASRAASTVFWPGCSAMKLEPELMRLTIEALGTEIPELGFSSWCCAKPTLAMGTTGQKQKREDQLSRYFAANGIRQVVTLCPNCRKTLGERTDIEVRSAWPILADFVRKHPQRAESFPGRYILHDPCASRNDEPSQLAARQILSDRGMEVAEFDHSASDTRCCGRINMLFLTNPESSRQMLQQRLQGTRSIPIVTYCESCVETFRGAGHEAIHLLEVIFDRPAARGIRQRLTNVHGSIRRD